MKSPCDEIIAQLLETIDVTTLSLEQRQHADSCEKCRSFLTALTEGRLEGESNLSQEALDKSWERIEARLPSTRKISYRRRLFQSIGPPAIIAASLLALLVVRGFLTREAPLQPSLRSAKWILDRGDRAGETPKSYECLIVDLPNQGWVSVISVTDLGALDVAKLGSSGAVCINVGKLTEVRVAIPSVDPEDVPIFLVIVLRQDSLTYDEIQKRLGSRILGTLSDDEVAELIGEQLGGKTAMIQIGSPYE